MRFLDDHIIGADLDGAIEIAVLDEPGQGGACHEYKLSVNHPTETYSTKINFQNGPVKEAGFNGLSQESLLAVVIDRLRSFQSGPYSCRENAIALTKCEEALHWLQQRTLKRIRRGIEGTNQK